MKEIKRRKMYRREFKMNIPGKFRDYTDARAVIFEFIEIWYNRKRLHSGLDYRTLAELEKLLTKQHAA